MNAEMITKREIRNKDDKAHYEIGPDRDGLQCIEILYYEDGNIVKRMSFPPDEAKLISIAIDKCADEIVRQLP